MRQLLLLRHAKSCPGDPLLADLARKLSARGRQDASRMRQAMRELGLTPDIVLVSTAARTIETLEKLHPWDETPLIEALESLYLAPAARMLSILRDTPKTARSVLVIGHNPGLHQLALLLAGPQAATDENSPARRLVEGYPTAALAEFAIAGPWHSLDAGGGKLLRFLTPRELPPPDLGGHG
jgi:phosphohistidine phosphatase